MEDRFDNYERYAMDMRTLLFAFDQGYPEAYELACDDSLVGINDRANNKDANAQTRDDNTEV